MGHSNYLVVLFHQLCFAKNELPWHLKALKYIVFGIMGVIMGVYIMYDTTKGFLMGVKLGSTGVDRKE